MSPRRAASATGSTSRPPLARLVDRRRALAQADDDVDAGVLEVQRVGVALRAEADDRDGLAVEEREVCVVVVEHGAAGYRKRPRGRRATGRRRRRRSGSTGARASRARRRDLPAASVAAAGRRGALAGRAAARSAVRASPPASTDEMTVAIASRPERARRRGSGCRTAADAVESSPRRHRRAPAIAWIAKRTGGHGAARSPTASAASARAGRAVDRRRTRASSRAC